MLAMIMAIEDDDDRLKAETLYRNYERKMFFAAKRILHNDMKSEDAVHNAFEGIIRNLHVIDNPDTARAESYVIRAAKNSAINIFNRDKRIVLIEDEKEQNKLKQMEVSGDTRELMEDIYELPQKYRDILILRAVYGYSYKEISIAFKISESAAMKRMERAKKRLELLLGGNVQWKDI